MEKLKADQPQLRDSPDSAGPLELSSPAVRELAAAMQRDVRPSDLAEFKDT